MESITPTLRLVFCVRDALQNGETVRHGLRHFVERHPTPLAWGVTGWLRDRDQGQINVFSEQLKSSECHLLRLLERGLRGEAILGHLQEFERELVERCESQIDEFIESLPLKSLMPLLFLIFPAYLILLLGPLVERLLSSLQ